VNFYKHITYGSHQAVLVQALRKAPAGPIAELGTGIFSTPLLHWLCLWQGLRLVSFESVPEFVDLFNIWRYPPHWNGHELIMVDDWAKAPLEQPWAVAFVDHEPASRRAPDARRLLDWATYVVVHDSGWWDDRHSHLRRDLFPYAKYRYDYRPTAAKMQTTVLSQTVDLSDFMGQP
jgi:hypothetical protein